MRRLLGLGMVLVSTACVDAGANAVEIPLQLRGAGTNQATAGAWSVALSEARLAFGPLHLCAGAEAGALCDTARAEWLDAAVVDTLESSPVQVGSLLGSEGPVSSFMYDLGLVSLLTQDDALRMPAAEQLGASIHLEGVASKDGIDLPFVAFLDIAQTEAAEKGRPVARSGAEDALDIELDEVSSLTVRFDPRPWVEDIDFDEFLEAAECSSDTPVSCVDQVELRCLADGSVDGTDCSLDGQVCQAGAGCVDRILIDTGSQGQRAIVEGILDGPQPLFEFIAE